MASLRLLSRSSKFMTSVRKGHWPAHWKHPRDLGLETHRTMEFFPKMQPISWEEGFKRTAERKNTTLVAGMLYFTLAVCTAYYFEGLYWYPKPPETNPPIWDRFYASKAAAEGQ